MKLFIFTMVLLSLLSVGKSDVKVNPPITLKTGITVFKSPSGNLYFKYKLNSLEFIFFKDDKLLFSFDVNNSEIRHFTSVHKKIKKVTTYIDKDGDGLPDIAIVETNGELIHYTLKFKLLENHRMKIPAQLDRKK